MPVSIALAALALFGKKKEPPIALRAGEPLFDQVRALFETVDAQASRIANLEAQIESLTSQQSCLVSGGAGCAAPARPPRALSFTGQPAAAMLWQGIPTLLCATTFLF